MKGAGLGGGIAVRRVSVSHIIGGGNPLKLVPPTSAFISGTPVRERQHCFNVDKSNFEEIFRFIFCRKMSNKPKAMNLWMMYQ